MGEVYKASDTRLDRTVAIKILPSTNADLQARFEREARTIASLQHPHICTLHDVGRQKGIDYLVMEYLEGRTLRSVLSERPLPAKVIVRYAIQLCQGLAAAHDRGIVHRDLKPENVFVTNNGQIKILDFGVAKLLQVSHAMPGRARDTGPGMVIGTVAYMSPEQIKGEPVDSRSDVFSLGIVLYEMVAGKHPFRGENYVETMHAILSAKPGPLSSADDPLSTVLNGIIERCLEKDRDRRFQSARGIFAIRGAQLVLAAPTAQNANDDSTEKVESVVTYRDPPNWLVWSGPFVIGLIILCLFMITVLFPPRQRITGCIKSADGRSATLVVSENGSTHQFSVYGPKGGPLHTIIGYHVITEVGHNVEVSSTFATRSTQGDGMLYVRKLVKLAGTCGETGF